jgi:hypothetical protein
MKRRERDGIQTDNGLPVVKLSKAKMNVKTLISLLNTAKNDASSRESALIQFAAVKWGLESFQYFFESDGVPLLCGLLKTSDYCYTPRVLKCLEKILSVSVTNGESWKSKIIESVIEADVVLLLKDFEKNK